MARGRALASSSSEDAEDFVLLLSPAKTLDLKSMTRNHPIPWTSPTCDAEKTNIVARATKSHARDANKLSKLLGISKSLADTAKKYWDQFVLENAEVAGIEIKPCGFAFSGAAYQGMDIQSLDEKQVSYLQKHLRIVDPLYGLLQPMDVIQPYRLEMASKNVLLGAAAKQKLAEFWKPSITDTLAKREASQSKPRIILNVASDEYSAALDDSAEEDIRMIKIVFRQEGRVLSVHAKRARGLFCRYMATHGVNSLADIVNFDYEGYKYQANESSTTVYIFDRSKYWNQAKNKTTSVSSGRATKRRKS